MKKILDIIVYSLFLFILFDFFFFRFVLGFGMINKDRWGFNTTFRQPEPYVDYILSGLMEDKTSYDKVDFFKNAGKDDIKVAFFGGSTGMPISEEYFSERLTKLFGKKVYVKNFSCASAQHRQHMHMVLELLPKYNPDIVVFYGGANEGPQNLIYDPRPGYPYNFYYKGETPTLKKFLIEYSALASSIEQRDGTITNYSKLKEEYQPGSEEWSDAIVEKYFDTLYLAKKTTETLNSKKYGHTKFIAFLQPLNIGEIPEYKDTHDKIRNKIKTTDYIFDIHNSFDNFDQKIWEDYCHVGYDENNEPNRHIVDVMSDIIAKKFPLKK